MGLTGIDVSNYNGIIDWQKVKKAGVNFAIIKIVKKDLTVDSRFESNWRGCKDNGIEIKEKDKIFHEWSASYILNAVFVAVEHCLAGKKAKSEFIKEPIFKGILDEDLNKELTEEEIAEKEIREQIKLESQYIASAINNRKSTK